MPIKRRNTKGRMHRITPEAVDAFVAGDYLELHLALALAPWQSSPLPQAVCALGVDPKRPPVQNGTAYAETWQLAVELQRELQAAAGNGGDRAD